MSEAHLFADRLDLPNASRTNKTFTSGLVRGARRQASPASAQDEEGVLLCQAHQPLHMPPGVSWLSCKVASVKDKAYIDEAGKRGNRINGAINEKKRRKEHLK